MEPLIPLKTSERLFVALSVVVQELERRTDYPTFNLHMILGHYESARDSYLKEKGWGEPIIRNVTAEAVTELNKWLDERAEQSVEAQNHLKLWEAELDDHPSVD